MKRNEIQVSFCHRIPERSFFWKGKQFPVCARCTGIHVGYLTFPFFLFSVFELNMWWTIALILPTFIDGVTQAFYQRKSNNFIRVTTGLLGGIGFMSFVSIIGKFVGNQIINNFNIF